MFVGYSIWFGPSTDLRPNLGPLLTGVWRVSVTFAKGRLGLESIQLLGVHPPAVTYILLKSTDILKTV